MQVILNECVDVYCLVSPPLRSTKAFCAFEIMLLPGSTKCLFGMCSNVSDGRMAAVGKAGDGSGKF